MSRTRVRRRRVATVAALALLGGVWTGRLAQAGHSDGSRPVAEHRYVVRQGDTLWDIAQRLGAEADPRPLMDAIQEANHVDPGRLTPGQTLVIPSA